MNNQYDTVQEFDSAIAICRELYIKKLTDYGCAWRLMRPISITDQLLIKADRIRSLETKGNQQVADESVLDGFIALVNYGIMGLIQLSLGFASGKDLTNDQAIELYDKYMDETRSLMLRKNHDYDEAWRRMRVSSYTDLILMKIMRTKEIEDNEGCARVSEGIDANYMDIVNYAIFGIIKINEGANA